MIVYPGVSKRKIAQLLLALTQHKLLPANKCLIYVNWGKISRHGDIIAVIESQHGTSPSVLLLSRPAPNHPAWMRNYLRNGFLETRTSPFGRRNHQVGSQGHIASGNFGCSRQALFGFKWAECDVFIDVTSPFNVCRSLGTFRPQTLPITCSIRSAGLHSLCNRKNWRAYSTTPPLAHGGNFCTILFMRPEENSQIDFYICG